MPSEREIRNLYVNGRTICIEVFFCFLKFFSVRRTRSRHRMGTILGAWGESLNKHFGRCNPAKIANMYMFALLANLWKLPMNITEFLIVLKQYSDCLRRFSKSLLKDMVEIWYSMIANCFCDVASGHIAFFKKFQSKFHPQCPNVFPNAFAFCKLKCFLELVFVKRSHNIKCHRINVNFSRHLFSSNPLYLKR